MNDSYLDEPSLLPPSNHTPCVYADPRLCDLLITFEYVVDMAHIVCAPFTIILNLMVMLLAVKYIDLSNRLNQWYVLSMTVSDLTYGIVYLSTKKFMAYFPRDLCQVYYTLSWVSQIMSIFSMLLLNVDKFISIFSPLNYHHIVTGTLVAGSLSLCWTGVVSYSVFTFYGPLSEFKTVTYGGQTTQCSPTINPINYLAMLVLLYIVPMIICFGISVFIYYIAKNLGRGGLSGLPESRVARQKVKQKMLKRIIFVFSSTMWTVLTFLPYRIFMAYYLTYCVFLQQQCATLAYLRVTGWSLWLFMPLGAIGNPIITIATQRVYMQSMNKFCRDLASSLHIPEKYCPCISRKTSVHQSPKFSSEIGKMTEDVNRNLIASSMRNPGRLSSSEIGTSL